MFNKLINAIKDMWADRTEACIIALAYVGFMVAFFLIGVTQAYFDGAFAFVLLTGVFALFVWLVKRIIAQ